MTSRESVAFSHLSPCLTHDSSGSGNELVHYVGRKASRLNGQRLFSEGALCCLMTAWLLGLRHCGEDKADIHNNPTTISSQPFLLMIVTLVLQTHQFLGLVIAGKAFWPKWGGGFVSPSLQPLALMGPASLLPSL